MKVVVTGGAGFIGANLVRSLVARSEVDEVVAYDDLSTGSRSNLEGTDVELVEAGIGDRQRLDEVVSKAGAVVHLAARPSVPRSLEDPVASHEANATGTVAVLEAARQTGAHVVVASSSSVYGANPTMPKREDLATLPVSPYAASKLATEAYALAWARSFGLDVLAFRFFNVYGPLQPAGHAYAAAVPTFVEAALKDAPLPIHGDGNQTRDFTFVDTVTAVITDAVVRRVTHDGPVNLAFGSRTSLLELIAALETILGRPLTRVHLPDRAGDVRDSQADRTRLHALFPDVQAVELHEGLRRTVDWFAQPSR
jgi:UDP-glucose 4-epimerase